MLELSSPSGPAFSLKVWVTDALSRWRMSHAGVDVYINRTRICTVVTGDDGGVLINITYQTVAPVTVVVSKDGYLPTALPYKAKRLPSKVLNAFAYVANFANITYPFWFLRCSIFICYHFAACSEPGKHLALRGLCPDQWQIIWYCVI